MNLNVPTRLEAFFIHLSNRLGRPITYKRFKASNYDPVSGETKEFWEEVSCQALFYSAKERSFTLPESVSSQAEAILVFPLASFTRQPGEPSEPWPRPGDEIVMDDGVWVPDLNGRVYAWTDPTKTLYFLAVRRQ